jgi:hypothetical protein
VDNKIAFIHVPKCAGTSLRDIFVTWFGKGVIPHYIYEPSGKTPTLLTEQYTNTVVCNFGICCVYGHFNTLRGFGVKDSIPYFTRFMTILRDPFSQFVSEYHYKLDRGRTKLDFVDYLTTIKPNYLNHFPREVTLENYVEVINDFEYVGLFEELSLSVQQLAVLFDKKLPHSGIKFCNVGNKTGANYEYLREDFELANPLEVLSYTYAKQKFFSQGK